jgi:hypothetical protein
MNFHGLRIHAIKGHGFRRRWRLQNFQECIEVYGFKADHYLFSTSTIAITFGIFYLLANQVVALIVNLGGDRLVETVFS